MTTEEGKLRLEVRLSGPERFVDSNYGPRSERDKLVEIDIPVTQAAWGFILSLVEECAKPVGHLWTPGDME